MSGGLGVGIIEKGNRIGWLFKNETNFVQYILINTKEKEWKQVRA